MENNQLSYEKEAQELTTELRKIYNNDDAIVLAVLSCVIDYKDDVNELLQFIRAGKDVTPETVSVYASEIDDARNG